MVIELIMEDIIFILCGFKDCFEVYYGVYIFDGVIIVVINLLVCYIIDRFLLDKVIDFIDEVCVFICMEIDFMLVEFDDV